MSIDLKSDLDLYETEYERLRNFGRWFNDKYAGSFGEPEAVAAEIGERLLDLGFRADVALSVTEQAATNHYTFHVRIVGRTEPREFDHERMAAEVRRAEGVVAEGLRDSMTNVSRGHSH